MKIEIDSFLSADDLKGATKEKPVKATIENVIFTEAADLPFDSDEGRYTVTVVLPKDKKREWSANKTSLRALKTEYGDESDDWKGKEVKLYCLDQNVRGEMKKVVYGEV